MSYALNAFACFSFVAMAGLIMALSGKRRRALPAEAALGMLKAISTVNCQKQLLSPKLSGE